MVGFILKNNKIAVETTWLKFATEKFNTHLSVQEDFSYQYLKMSTSVINETHLNRTLDEWAGFVLFCY